MNELQVLNKTPSLLTLEESQFTYHSVVKIHLNGELEMINIF